MTRWTCVTVEPEVREGPREFLCGLYRDGHLVRQATVIANRPQCLRPPIVAEGDEVVRHLAAFDMAAGDDAEFRLAGQLMDRGLPGLLDELPVCVTAGILTEERGLARRRPPVGTARHGQPACQPA